MKWISLLFTLFILVLIVWANTGNMPHALKIIYDFPSGDKAGHIILFGILSYLLNYSASSMLEGPPGSVVLRVSLFLIILVGFEEWTQQFLANRTSSWIDLAFSYSGIMIGAWLAWRYWKTRSN